MKQITRDDTEHGATYYLASEVDALLQELDAELEIANALLKARLENSATEAQRKPLTDSISWQFKKFREWSSDAGYDTAHTHDGVNWICLNPMTSDLWKAWQAAHGIKEQQ